MDPKLPDPDAFAKRIHDTLVAPEATASELAAFCATAKKYRFGAVVVQGCWVKEAKGLVGDDVKVSAGVGFPMGGVTAKSKVAEIRETAELGADMFDVMPNIGFLRSGMEAEFRDEIAAMVDGAGGRPVRVMLEFTILDREQKVRAAKLSEQAGVAGVKNSSGWGRGGPATVDDIRLLRESVSPRVHVKASGGIRDLDNALSLVDAGADFLGTRAGVAIIDELRERLGR
ncbi:MAG: deoxyribose-phosphate aldolase [Nitrososphaerota archaeon]|jgi:deoxyribose-phosphate aldolase|nr:deoxyribose-phosphate aldolase [Nitrososphaerota archaeon]MDG6956530.1 deoxyribose-phosphate aldolase [Nitrososphaerota archaeon]MDG6959707.1 deoxyribose-phosphate aldolase [Nitrososphaerota archaeon]MDG6965045.1 deoxyribose-phosphate aldolase [Nitrososphaerota archaeon]MDG6968093.1 deoxyribose-phosphate aldolase [Nitrososphaerota archaeon]